jgi:FAD/FMN-containing dehydrogenase
MIQDAVEPRSRLPEVLRAAYDIAARNQLRIANVFHAGDGNLHPLICFDSRFEDQVRRVKEAGRELMEVCVAAGGTITGEHGVGLDKRELLPLVFSEADMSAMLSVRAAFDPLGLCNPGKIIPMLRGCGEAKAVATDDTDNTDIISSQLGAPFESQRTNISFQTSVVSVSSVAFPSSTEELSEIMKRAFAERWTVTPVGGKTSLENPATSLTVNTSRLDKIIEHEPSDLIAVAQAGVTLSAFNKTLAENGQWLPLDPPDDGRATLGGVIATGLGGAQQFGYGRPRGSVIGMKVVLADGSVIKAGGRVVKNVAGYDLCKLFTGSYGTLGIITELIFKLRPRPAREATVLATGSIDKLLSAGRALIDARLFPVAVELISSTLSKRLDIDPDETSAVLLVRFAGNDKSVAYQIEQTLVQLKNSGVKSSEVPADDSQLWQSLAALPVKNQPSSAMHVLPSKLAGSLSSIPAGALWQAGVADGRLRTFNEPARHRSLDALSQRIKQQLDPFNLFKGHDHEHAA